MRLLIRVFKGSLVSINYSLNEGHISDMHRHYNFTPLQPNRHMCSSIWLASLIITSLVWMQSTWSDMTHTLGLAMLMLSAVSIRSRDRTLSESGFSDKFTYKSREAVLFWTYTQLQRSDYMQLTTIKIVDIDTSC